jgi:hypothetical protein
MDNAMGMGEFKAATDLDEQVDYCVEGELFPRLHQITKGSAIKIFHGDIVGPMRGPYVVDGYDIRMIQSGCGTGLLQKAKEGVPVLSLGRTRAVIDP